MAIKKSTKLAKKKPTKRNRLPVYVVVEFFPQGDGVTALYRDGKLHTKGDYHDKISDWIEGFERGVRETNPRIAAFTSHEATGKSGAKIDHGCDEVPEDLKTALELCKDPSDEDE